MNIAIIGYGKMGMLVAQIARCRGHTIKSIIDPQAEDATHKHPDEGSLRGVDVAIEFSQPEAVIDNIKAVSACKVCHVVATTGWHDQLDEAKKALSGSKSGFMFAPNFSIGVNLFYRMIENASRLMSKIDAYDVFGYELHHSRKKDSPSGTAKAISDVILRNFSRKTKIVEDRLNRKIAEDELHFASIRGGDVPGTHVVTFDSNADSIELKHTARSREGFAYGAVLASEWLKGKSGFFSIDDMLNEVLR